MRVMPNSLIKASAGTGKTFALTTRMIRLMLLGVDPCQIVALTFSRAAAGEIFNRLAGRLAEAAASEKNAQTESERVFHSLESALAQAIRERHGAVLTRACFAAQLRGLIATQHQSMIGTIDSFMTRMVQAFPLELGLQGPMTIMDDYRTARERQSAMARLLNQGADTPDAEAFFEAFRQALFGRETKSYSENLARFVQDWHSVIQDVPDGEAWGRPQRIWPNGAPFVLRPSLADIADRLAAEIRGDWEAVGRAETWDDFCAFVRTFDATLPSALPAAIRNVIAAYRAAGDAIEISYNRKAIGFTGEKARLIRQAVEALFAVVLRARCETTQGVFRLMSRIENGYAADTRSRGLLTFDDVPRLISGLDASVRQNIEYRFDGRFRHWALDEFQDTSRAQWSAIRNLVDEVIQSEDDERSLFIVGDSKQAIYGWRGGDVAILEEEIASGHYALADLSESYRYGPQIAAFVNAVFDGPALAEALQGAGFGAAGEKWRSLWLPHASSRPPSFVSVERMEAADRSAEEKTVSPYVRAAADHLLRVRPWARGISAAVLVRSNEHGKRFADALRGEGVPVVWEGESAICDTPVITALLHLLHVAEHPGDTLAWRHVCASPLAETVFREACAAPAPQGTAQLSRRVLDDVSRLGLDRALRSYIEALPEGGLDDFTRARLNDLVRAAAAFAAETDDETQLSDFAAFVETFITRDIADTSTVKILTIHRSKGLGFDFVILPVIESVGITSVRSGETLFAPDGSWLLADPGKTVAEADPILQAARESNARDAVFEALCVQYVAMTRAKRALVVLLKPAAKAPGETLYFSDHVERALRAPLPWSDGDPGWFAALQAPAAAEAAPTLPAAYRRERRRVVHRATPSASAAFGSSASDLFVRQENRALQRGTRLHEALRRIEWLDVNAPQPPELPQADLDLSAPSAFRDALTRPPGAVDLWRERAFERIDGDRWVSGVFDRVVFFDESGKLRADIFDFKSNRRRPDESEEAFAQRMVATYAAQMSDYRQALAQLSGLSPSAIRCTLLLTATRQAVSV